jgi:S1-C subfamily serine protease
LGGRGRQSVRSRRLGDGRDTSALRRDINEGPYDDFLQIDAPINRGNSGGPTFNLHGRVIGINTAIYSPSGGSVRIGFAVPSNIAKQVVVQLKEHGHVTWGWLGVAIQNVTPAIAKSLGLDPATPIEAFIGEMPQNVASAEREAAQPGSGKAANALGMELLPLDPQLRRELQAPKDLNGVVVGQVASGSPAGDLAIQPGDVIVSVDQKTGDHTRGRRRSVKAGRGSREPAVAAQPSRDEPVRRLVGREQRNGREQPLSRRQFRVPRRKSRGVGPHMIVATAGQIDHGRTALSTRADRY